jgi:8-oxo-dGTP diphosphatase
MHSTKQAVYGIVFSQKRDQVLLIKRRDIPVWVLPGGGVEEGESAETAVIREMNEEIGVKVNIVRKVAEYLPVNRLTQLTHLYECLPETTDFSRTCETSDIGFFPLRSLPKHIPPPFACWIEDAAAVSQDLIIKKIEGVTYWILIKLLLMHPILVFRFLLTKIGIHINSRD